MVLVCAVGLLLAATDRGLAQGTDPAGRPIGQVEIKGLRTVPEQLVRNAIRISPGDAFDAKIVHEDIVRITHLGRFRTVVAEHEQQADGSLIVTYVVSELPLIADIQVAGNKAISDHDLLSLVNLRKGDPVDQFLIDQGTRQIVQAYEKKGYYLTDVTVDAAQLDETGVLIFRVREGPHVRIRDISFTGNTVFSDKELKSRIKSKAYVMILQPGALSRRQLDDDAAALRKYYRERGYRDAQVGRDVQMSANQKDAVVVFLIEEGKLFTVESIRVEGNEQFADAQILEMMQLKVGDVYSEDLLAKSREATVNLYGKLGFIETKVRLEPLFHEADPKVSLVVHIKEGKSYTVGGIEIRGNRVTKSRVITRQIRGMEPGRPFDLTGVKVTKDRLGHSPLFEKASVTILGDPADDARDVLVEVEEKNTGSFSFGAGVSSDSGVVGAISLTQRNFDIANPPDSFSEFITGKAFRGAGQYFAITLQPGNETSRYSVAFREPYLLDSDYFLDTNLFYYDRERSDYDEKRAGGKLGLGQRFGDVWSASIAGRYEAIDIANLDPTVPDDVAAVAGDSDLTTLGFTVRRSTTDSPLFPTRGSRLSAGISRAGALGGDYDYTKLNVKARKYWTIDEDFLNRRTVFSVSATAGYVLESDEAPVFERYYAGGHRTLRGFDYRGVGPRGIIAGPPLVQTDDPVGGDWLFLLSFEYNFPVYQEVLRVVLFSDTGTVQDDFGLDEYRMSVGAGLRLAVPFLGRAPFAFDFAVPVVKEPDDETQVFSFDIALPF